MKLILLITILIANITLVYASRDVIESDTHLSHRRHHVKRDCSPLKRTTTQKKSKPKSSKKKSTKKITKKPKAKSSTSTSSGALKGITQFLGKNSGIGSWFRADNTGDSTNGHSWCGFPYNDNSNGFAPSVGRMLGNFGNNYNTAAEHYCGLEATVKNPHNGKTLTMYIIDGFADEWVRTPGSIDIMKNHFTILNGAATDNKDIVIQGVEWEFTGRRSTQYSFKGKGN